MGQSKEETKTVERDIVVPEQREDTISQTPVNRMAGETFLSATKRATPTIQTTVTPGTTTRVREEVPLSDDEKKRKAILDFFQRKLKTGN